MKMPRVLHVSYAWFPDACGGTEVYVQALATALAGLGWLSEVAVASTEVQELTTDSAALLVHRVPAPAQFSHRVLYGEGEPTSAAFFSRLLAEMKPDVVHFHAFGPSVSVLWLEAARAMRIACVYTYHTPTLACGRGTLMRWGKVPCDGRMTPLRCAACTLHGLGVAKSAALALAALSPFTGLFWSKVPFRIWPLIWLRIRAARQWLAGMQRVVSLSAWSKSVMERNGVPATRLRLLRHGLAGGGKINTSPDDEAGKRADEPMQGVVRVGFFGRVDRAKGLRVLAEVMRLRPKLAIKLHCHLIGESSAEPALQELVKGMRQDQRVQIHPPVSPDCVVGVMAGYDAVLVPSEWLETGPLVVLEAFAAGVPVIGSDLGGIAEWVLHGQNGLLCPAGDGEAWAEALEMFATEATLRARLRAGVQPPPSMVEVAAQMVKIYQEAIDDAA